MTREKTKNELRCFCSRKPLLAMYGINEKGQLYIHIRVFKQDRIFGEMVAISGEVKLRCRDCLRWHSVRMRVEKPELIESTDPLPIVIEV